MKPSLRELVISVALFTLISVLALPAAHAAPSRHALLIGVGDYISRKAPDLEGPVHDVKAMRELLISRWGFEPGAVEALVDKQATLRGSLAALDRLEQRSAPGDLLFIYFSGHGSSVHGGIPMPESTGSLIPHDFSTANIQAVKRSMMIGVRDLRPRLQRLDRAGRRLFVVIDACYSGNSVRSLEAGVTGGRALPSRHVSLPITVDVRALGLQRNLQAQRGWPYQNLIYFAAASEREPAQDIPRALLRHHPTFDMQPHGAFSDAFLRVLSGDLSADIDRDGVVSYEEAYQSIQRFMAQRKYSHTPQILPRSEPLRSALAKQSLFDRQPAGNPSSASGSKPQLEQDDPLRVAIVGAVGLRSQLNRLDGVKVVYTKDRDLTIAMRMGRLLLVDGSGDLIGEYADSSSGRAALVGRVEQEAWLEQLVVDLSRREQFPLRLEQVGVNKGAVAVEGEELALAIHSDQPVQLLLFDVTTDGSLIILYPYDSHELGRVTQVRLPAQSDEWLEVEPPLGSERLIAIGFRSGLRQLERFANTTLRPGSSELSQLRQLIKAYRGELGYASLTLRTISQRDAARADRER